MEIGGKGIGEGNPVFVIAELSANHNQDFDVAVETIKAMKEAGADAVKLQTFTPDTITLDADSEIFRIKGGTLWDGRTLHELYREGAMPWEWQPKLKEVSEGLGLIFFSSPFDKTAVDFLEGMDVPAFKVASFEITDIPLIEYVASKGKPIIISTGIATEEEIEEAVAACRRVNNDDIVLLKCTSAYPAPLDELNLRMIPELAERFGVVAGLSDHTIGITVPIVAVALGAHVVEKHVILDKQLGGPDAAFSLEPHELKEMVGSIRETELALGTIDYALTRKMREGRAFARSLFITEDVGAGEEATEENVRSVRPAGGLAPVHLKEVLGKRFTRSYRKGTPLSWDCVE